MRTPRALLALLIAPLAACKAHVPTAGDEDTCKAQVPAAADEDEIIYDSGRCDAVLGGTDFSSCHWHHFSVGLDPGTAVANAFGSSGVTEVPIVVEVFPTRWLSIQAGTGPGPTWPSPLTLAARLHACNDDGCSWYLGGYWEPWRKSTGLVHQWVLGAAFGYRFETHLDWSSSEDPKKAWGPHLYAAPALAVDLWSQAPDAAGAWSLSPHLQLEVGWSF